MNVVECLFDFDFVKNKQDNQRLAKVKKQTDTDLYKTIVQLPFYKAFYFLFLARITELNSTNNFVLEESYFGFYFVF